MGKNSRRQKKLKSERAKVHIKSKTKFLPKGQNVTNTTFKVRTIEIREQLQERTLNTLHHNVPELLTKLRHFNDSRRIEACEKLQEVIKGDQGVAARLHLSDIIQYATALIQEKEHKVRAASIKLLNEVLRNTPPENLIIFPLLITNLRCAMTNINKHIQEDSLLLLDGLLEHSPTLIAKNAEKLFPDFLLLISTLRNNSSIEKTLTINLEKKVTSVQWRIAVFSRLYYMLDIIVREKRAEQIGNKVPPVVDVTKTSYYPLFPSAEYVRMLQYPCMNFLGSGNDYFFNNENVLSTQISSLVPLLHETWLEAFPEKAPKKKTDNFLLLSDKSVTVFRYIVKITYLLQEYVQLADLHEIFKSAAWTKFISYLMINFPYSQARQERNPEEQTKGIPKIFALKNEFRCTEENLLLIRMYAHMRENPELKSLRSTEDCVHSYLNKCLQDRIKISATNLKYIISILKDILQDKTKLWCRMGANPADVLENAITFYESRSYNANEILKVLTCPDKSLKSDKYKTWIYSLQDMLCAESISVEVIVFIFEKIKKSNCAWFHSHLIEILPRILENLPRLQIKPEATKDVKLKLAYIFFYLRDLSDIHTAQIEQFTLCQTGDYAALLLEVMQHRKFYSCQDNHTGCDDYL